MPLQSKCPHTCLDQWRGSNGVLSVGETMQAKPSDPLGPAADRALLRTMCPPLPSQTLVGLAFPCIAAVEGSPHSGSTGNTISPLSPTLVYLPTTFPHLFPNSTMPKKAYFIDETGNSKPNWPNSRKKTFARGANGTRMCPQSPAGLPEPLRLDAQSHSGCLAYSLHTSPRHVDSTSYIWCIESAHNRVSVAG